MRKLFIVSVVGLLNFGGMAYAQTATNCLNPASFSNGLPANATAVNQAFGALATCVNNVASGGQLSSITLIGTTLFPGSGTITSSGNVGIGTVNPTTTLDVEGATAAFRIGNSTHNFGVYPEGAGTAIADTANYIRFANSSGEVLRISGANVGIGTTSPVHLFQVNTSDAAKPGGGSWVDSSDVRLKVDIRGINGEQALASLSRLQPVSFKWIHPELHGNEQLPGGFVAQEVLKVFPEFVLSSPCSGADCSLVGGQGNAEYGLRLPFKFDAYLVASIQELEVRTRAIKDLRAANDRQAAEISALKITIVNQARRLSALEGRISSKAASSAIPRRRTRVAAASD